MKAAAAILLVVSAAARAEAPSCPATFAAATGACDERASPPGRACAFAQGKCTCVRSTPCSGVPQPPGEPRWRCEPKRTDGCPDQAPRQDTACKLPGKSCSYGSCGGMTYTCAPDKRTWYVSAVISPPPSASIKGTGPGFVPLPPPEKKPQEPRPNVRAAPPAWKTCPAGSKFGCAARSQGAAPARGEQVPRVCGCLPTCPPARHVLISSDAGGTWPDGSHKGRFTCASSGLPSAMPRGPGF